MRQLIDDYPCPSPRGWLSWWITAGNSRNVSSCIKPTYSIIQPFLRSSVKEYCIQSHTRLSAEGVADLRPAFHHAPVTKDATSKQDCYSKLVFKQNRSSEMCQSIAPETHSGDCDSSFEAPAKRAPPCQFHLHVTRKDNHRCFGLPFSYLQRGHLRIWWFFCSRTDAWMPRNLGHISQSPPARQPRIQLHSGAESTRHADRKAFSIHGGQVNPRSAAETVGILSFDDGWEHPAPSQ